MNKATYDVKIVRLLEHSKKHGYKLWRIKINGKLGTYLESLKKDHPSWVREWPKSLLEKGCDNSGKLRWWVRPHYTYEESFLKNLKSQIEKALTQFKVPA